MKKHFLVLDSLRGLCASLVALSHFNAYSYLSGYKIVDFGAVYVDFFFVLSGFVIFANYAEKLRAGFGIKNFMILRLGRLYPLHFAVLMAFVLFDVLQYFLPRNGAALFPPFSAPGETPFNIAANFLLVHSLHITDTLIFNGPSWSISVELFTYLLFAFIFVFVRKFRNLFVAALGLLSAILLYYLAGELYAKLDYGFLRCVYGFACGGLVWELYNRVHKKVDTYNMPTAGWSAAEATLFILAGVYITFLSEGLFSMAAPLLMGLIIFCFSFEKGVVSALLKSKFFLLLGTLSYSIYMTHMFISGKFFELSVRILESRKLIDFTQVAGNIRLYGHDKISGTLFELFYLLVVVACSYLSYRIIEQPFRAWARKIVKDKQIHE